MTESPKPKFDAEWEPFIPYADESTCPPEHAASLAAVKGKMGFLSNSIRHYLHNPAVLGVVLAMTRGINHNPATLLGAKLHRQIGVICSSTNGCVYCTTHQCSYLTRPTSGPVEGWGLSLDEVSDLIAGQETAANAFERVCFDYARAASENPGGVTDELRARLREHLTPAQIMELAATVGYWKFINTIHDSLKIPVESKNLHATGYLEAWKMP